MSGSSSRWLLGAILVLLCVDQGSCQYFKQFYNQMWGVNRREQGSVKIPSTSASALPLPSLTSATNVATRTSRDYLSGLLPPGRAYGRFNNQRWSGDILARGHRPTGSPGMETSPPRAVEAVESATGMFPEASPPEPAVSLPSGTVLSLEGIPRTALEYISSLPSPGRSGRFYNQRWRGDRGRPGLPGREITPPNTELVWLPPGMTLSPEGIPKSALVVRTGDPDYTRFRQIFLRQLCNNLLNGPRAAEFSFCFSLLNF
ncbi:uncharacterized protein [Littorina saxatilis]|uniref:Uncharacterized protein n=1 Tax=Littorina saxatilis TaxID=31220 RepID=A0AAN9GLT9_9CAEN